MTFHISYERNKNIKFLHLVNFLVSYELMAFEESIKAYKQFKLGKDIILEIPDEFVGVFRDNLNSLGGATG